MEMTAPKFSYNFTIASFTLLNAQVVKENLHYRVLSASANGRICDSTNYYNFTRLLVKGKYLLLGFHYIQLIATNYS